MTIRLVVADLDGTLLTDDKKITPATVEAARKLRKHGVALTLASARPPLGMRFPVMQLDVTGRIAAFNGGMIVRPVPGMPVYSSRSLSSRLVQPVADTLALHGLDMWAYAGLNWYIKDRHGARVAWESSCVGIYPHTLNDWSELPGRPSKLVGVSNTEQDVYLAEELVNVRFRTALNAARSTPFYLDITPPGTDKGRAVEELAEWYGVPLTETAVIGDGEVDMPMFLLSGVTSVAMGNAPALVRSMASHVTTSNEENGFAKAVEEIILALSATRQKHERKGTHDTSRRTGR
jgi:Cof subfamily protein (haloacid dehalogenase superfamily)